MTIPPRLVEPIRDRMNNAPILFPLRQPLWQPWLPPLLRRTLCSLAVAFAVMLLAVGGEGNAQGKKSDGGGGSEILESTTVMTLDSSLRVAIRNIDITKFPFVSIVFDVFDRQYRFVDSLRKSDIVITENGAQQEVTSLSLITNQNRVPVDFVFLIDHTGSMGDKIDAVKQNIDEFTTRLAAKGIDYRLGLVVFDDNVNDRYWLTDNINEFKGWVSKLKAEGGGDEPENALEALRAATGMNFRSSANRCVILITDASYHAYGSGRTMYNARTISTILNRFEIRAFCITSPAVEGYSEIAERTGGQLFDIRQPFSQVLNQFANTMTSLYTATYRSRADYIPDSIRVEIRLPNQKVTVKKSFAVLEVGRKLVLDNIRFATNKYSIEAASMPELDYLVSLMKARPTMRLKIEGHTDDAGDHFFNMKLSNLRAESVRNYMVRKGIEPKRLFTVGYGETRPTATNETEEGRHLNRRTEFIILQK
ncbi:MAG: VWA domain-containing protein [Chlorobi bacterium CHB2]|nr:OmpA family protein [Candidatus Kapabacteria bacterium]MCE7933015.1 VWA domain-containing protein [Chlorobi bacterium CHB2]